MGSEPSKRSTQTPLQHTKNSRYCSHTKQNRRMEPAATVAREIVSSRMTVSYTHLTLPTICSV